MELINDVLVFDSSLVFKGARNEILPLYDHLAVATQASATRWDIFRN